MGDSIKNEFKADGIHLPREERDQVRKYKWEVMQLEEQFLSGCEERKSWAFEDKQNVRVMHGSSAAHFSACIILLPLTE